MEQNTNILYSISYLNEKKQQSIFVKNEACFSSYNSYGSWKLKHE